MTDTTPIYRLSAKRMEARKMAQSRYRQVRLTFTQETTGRLSYSVYAKGLNMDWTEKQCLVRDQVHLDAPLMTTEDVCHALIVILREQLLPGSID